MSHRRRVDAGSVTAETALVLPALIMVALLLVWSVTVGAAQVRCFDAARGAARAVARGEPLDDVQRRAQDAAPTGARVTITRLGDEVTVAVELATSAPPWMPALPSLRVAGSATAIAEDADVSGGFS
jgi:hypothetical protein